MSTIFINSISPEIGEEHLRQAFVSYGPIKLVNIFRGASTVVTKKFLGSYLID
jgi:hypothetical protein